ncbi:hypothetical protein CMMCAS04_11855 [Clavibacter michiganensis subsp. michiganensis]|nr:hypothetical protein CMMCAS04_11855 [Clavibacter michiganensis subsp. michiganensis]
MTALDTTRPDAPARVPRPDDAAEAPRDADR